jgi:DNA-binding MarR family transcriptional regulator
MPVAYRLERNESIMNKTGLAKLLKITDEFRKIDPEMPLQQITVLTLVAFNSGITMKDIGERMGMAQSTVSRNCAALGKTHRLGVAGKGLISTAEDPHERRRKIVSLTPKGRLVMQSVLEALE